MTQDSRELNKTDAQPGVSLPEYFVLLFLVGVFCLVGLKATGGSISGLLGDAIEKLGIAGTVSAQEKGVLASAKEAGDINSDSSQLASNEILGATLVTDPTTGQPTVQLTGSDSSSGTNVSSSEGQQDVLRKNNTKLSSDTLKAIQSFQQLAKDKAPRSKAFQYYNQLALWTYYLGATEGVLDNVQGLTLNSVQGYTPQQALTDLINYQHTLKKIANNPPKSISSKEVNTMVTPLLQKTLAIAETYKQDNSQFINKNGSVKKNINFADAYDFGLSQQQLRSRKTTSYDSIISEQRMRNRAKSVLKAPAVATVRVVDTMSTGNTLDNTSTKVSSAKTP